MCVCVCVCVHIIFFKIWKQTVTKQYFQECLDSLRGAVMIAFPEGLPEWDDVPLILKGEWEIDGISTLSISLSFSIYIRYLNAQ